jgi:hypothetical protein
MDSRTVGHLPVLWQGAGAFLAGRLLLVSIKYVSLLAFSRSARLARPMPYTVVTLCYASGLQTCRRTFPDKEK